MKRFPRVRSSCLALAVAGLLGCGGAESHLEPRFVAVHNAMVASGLAQSGPIHRGELAEGKDQRMVTELEEGECTTFVALGSGAVRNVDLRIRAEGGEEVGRDATEDREAAVRVCPDRSGEYQIIIHMADGGGAFLVSSWSGAPRGAGGAEAVVAASGSGRGTCAEPLPLEVGRPERGDTRRGASVLTGNCGGRAASEQVYRVDLEKRSQLSVRVQSGFDAVVYLMATCGDRQTEVGCNDDAERGQTGRAELDATVDAGTWFVVVDGYRDEAGDFEVSVSASELQPVAEVCGDAMELQPGRPTSGTTSNVPDQFQATCAGGARSPDRVYEIEVAQRSRLRVRQRSDHDGVLYLRSTCTEPGTELACNDDMLDPQHAVLHRVLDPGTHYVFTDGFSGRGRTSAGNFTMTAELEPARGSGIAGDACGSAEALAEGRAVELDTFAATDDLAGSCGGGGAPDAVYRFDLRRRSRIRARIHASEFDGFMYVRSDCDDADSEKACVKIPAASPRDQRGTLDVVLGTGTHYLVVDGEDEHAFGTAEIELHTSDLAALERTCRKAPQLRDGRSQSGNTAGKGDGFQGSCASSGGGHDTVFRLRVRRRSKVELTLSSEFDAVLHLRRDCADPSTEVACNDDHGDNRHSRVEATLEPGTYYVVVDGFRPDQSGDFVLETSVAGP